MERTRSAQCRGATTICQNSAALIRAGDGSRRCVWDATTPAGSNRRCCRRKQSDSHSTDDCTVEYVLTLHRFDEEQNIDVPITVDARNAGVLSRGNVHMANDGRSFRKNNALFTWYGFLRSTTRIRAGEEIFVSYPVEVHQRRSRV